MENKLYHVHLTLLSDMLGTVPKDRQVFTTYIQSLGTDNEDEAETAPVATSDEERGWTGFHTLANGTPAIYDYMIKGFFKDACSMLRRVSGSQSAKVTAFKKIIDGLVFIEPRLILLKVNGEMSVNERPLRAATPQGERVALVRSDSVPAGTELEFTINVLGDTPSEDLLREWLDYGKMRGLGQWRNGGWGRFDFEIS